MGHNGWMWTWGGLRPRWWGACVRAPSGQLPAFQPLSFPSAQQEGGRNALPAADPTPGPLSSQRGHWWASWGSQLSPWRGPGSHGCLGVHRVGSGLPWSGLVPHSPFSAVGAQVPLLGRGSGGESPICEKSLGGGPFPGPDNQDPCSEEDLPGNGSHWGRGETQAPSAKQRTEKSQKQVTLCSADCRA